MPAHAFGGVADLFGSDDIVVVEPLLLADLELWSKWYAWWTQGAGIFKPEFQKKSGILRSEFPCLQMMVLTDSLGLVEFRR